MVAGGHGGERCIGGELERGREERLKLEELTRVSREPGETKDAGRGGAYFSRDVAKEEHGT